MIRKDREITDKKAILEIIRRCHICHLAFNDIEDGFPYIVPLNFGIMTDENRVWLVFHCARRGKKLDLLNKDNRVAFAMECDVALVYNPAHGHNTDIFKSVTGRGLAHIVKDEADKIEMLQALVDRYHDNKLTVTAKDASHCTIFCVEVTEMWGKEKKVKA